MTVLKSNFLRKKMLIFEEKKVTKIFTNVRGGGRGGTL